MLGKQDVGAEGVLPICELENNMKSSKINTIVTITAFINLELF